MEENSKLLGIFQAAGHAVLGLGLRVSGLGHSNDGSRTGTDEPLTNCLLRRESRNGKTMETTVVLGFMVSSATTIRYR